MKSDAEMIAADPGDQGRLQPQPRRAHGGVGRAAADVFGEGAHVLQSPARLFSVEIDAGVLDGDQVEASSGA